MTKIDVSQGSNNNKDRVHYVKCGTDNSNQARICQSCDSAIPNVSSESKRPQKKRWGNISWGVFTGFLILSAIGNVCMSLRAHGNVLVGLPFILPALIMLFRFFIPPPTIARGIALIIGSVLSAGPILRFIYARSLDGVDIAIGILALILIVFGYKSDWEPGASWSKFKPNQNDKHKPNINNLNAKIINYEDTNNAGKICCEGCGKPLPKAQTDYMLNNPEYSEWCRKGYCCLSCFEESTKAEEGMS